VAEVIKFLFLRILFLKSRQGLFKPADAPKNMAPIDTTTTAVAVSSETSQGNHLTGNRTHLFMRRLHFFPQFYIREYETESF
jgi:inosine-uridine nucleoside N-ribohydrolase